MITKVKEIFNGKRKRITSSSWRHINKALESKQCLLKYKKKLKLFLLVLSLPHQKMLRKRRDREGRRSKRKERGGRDPQMRIKKCVSYSLLLLNSPFWKVTY